MAIDETDVQNFFNDYGLALQARDAGAIARYWASPSFVLSDQGGIPVKDAAEVEAFFSSSMSQYDGIAEAKAKIVDLTWQSQNVATVQVDWEHTDGEGTTVGGERGMYMLTKQKEGQLGISVYAPILDA